MRPLSREELAVRLKEARIAAGFKRQGDFAAALDVGQSTVCSWEVGKSEPRRDIWEKIAAACNTTVAALFFEANEESSDASTGTEIDINGKTSAANG